MARAPAGDELLVRLRRTAASSAPPSGAGSPGSSDHVLDRLREVVGHGVYGVGSFTADSARRMAAEQSTQSSRAPRSSPLGTSPAGWARVAEAAVAEQSRELASSLAYDAEIWQELGGRLAGRQRTQHGRTASPGGERGASPAAPPPAAPPPSALASFLSLSWTPGQDAQLRAGGSSLGGVRSGTSVSLQSAASSLLPTPAHSPSASRSSSPASRRPRGVLSAAGEALANGLGGAVLRVAGSVLSAAGTALSRAATPASSRASSPQRGRAPRPSAGCESSASSSRSQSSFKEPFPRPSAYADLAATAVQSSAAPSSSDREAVPSSRHARSLAPAEAQKLHAHAAELQWRLVEIERSGGGVGPFSAAALRDSLRLQAAVTIQAAWWKHQVRRMDAARRHTAATTIQAQWRGSCVRARFSEQMERHVAATILQSVWRGRAARARFPLPFLARSKLETKAALTIQAGWLGMHARMLDGARQSRAATLIAAAWRGFATRIVLARRAGAAATIQKAFWARESRRLAAARRHTAATRIQTRWRGVHARRAYAQAQKEARRAERRRRLEAKEGGAAPVATPVTVYRNSIFEEEERRTPASAATPSTSKSKTYSSPGSGGALGALSRIRVASEARAAANAAHRAAAHATPAPLAQPSPGGAEERKALAAFDAHGQNALHACVAAGDEESFLLLLPLMEDVDARTVAGVEAGSREPVIVTGKTALHVACETGRSLMARELLSCGASLSARDSFDETPLHLAAAGGHLGCVNLLLSKLAPSQIDATNVAGWTALHGAAFHAHQSVCAALLAAGAVRDAKDGEGDTPRDLAVLEHQDDVALLELLGGAEEPAEAPPSPTPVGPRASVLWALAQKGAAADSPPASPAASPGKAKKRGKK